VPHHVRRSGIVVALPAGGAHASGGAPEVVDTTTEEFPEDSLPPRALTIMFGEDATPAERRQVLDLTGGTLLATRTWFDLPQFVVGMPDTLAAEELDRMGARLDLLPQVRIVDTHARDDPRDRLGTRFTIGYSTPCRRNDGESTADTVIRRFVDSLRLPDRQAIVERVRLRERDIVVFAVSFGTGENRGDFCAHSSALGLRHGRKIGWLRFDLSGADRALDSTLARTRYVLDARADSFLFSPEFFPAIRAATNDDNYRWLEQHLMLPWLLESTAAPPSMLRRYAEASLAVPGDWLPRAVIANPNAQRDAATLTLLAFLRHGAPKEHALRALRELAPRLVRDPDAPKAALFLLAQMLDQPGDSSLADALAEHPAVRADIAILTIIAMHDRPRVAARVLALVQAPAGVKDTLARLLAWRAGWISTGDPDDSAAMRLLRNPAVRTNEGVLTVIANRRPGVGSWQAQRLLPDRVWYRGKLFARPPL